MITVVADTHGTDGHRLEGRTLTAVREASLVVHAGDFTTTAALDAFEAEACADAPAGDTRPDAGRTGDCGRDDTGFVGVYGNSDRERVRERLPRSAVVQREGVRIAAVHGHEHDGTALGLLGRGESADLVVVGHSHRPGVDRAGDVRVLNPGSHADPRRYRPAHAELEPAGEGLFGRLVQPDGTVFGEFDVAVRG